jgi:hypothetical protein
MSDSEKIGKAISAHADWKLRLKSAIDTGKSEWTVERVNPDNLCDFGKWLYSLPESDRQNIHWPTVRELHAIFHKEAARVLGLALNGKPQEARDAMAFGSLYATNSSKLTWAMMEWRKSITR